MHNKIKELEEAVQRLSAYYGSYKAATVDRVIGKYELMFWEQFNVVNNISKELTKTYPIDGNKSKIHDKHMALMDKAIDLSTKMLENADVE